MEHTDSKMWSVQKYLLMLVFGIILVWYVQYMWRRRKLYIYSWKVQGPFAFPIVGAGYLFLGSPSDILNNILRLQKHYSSLVKIWFGPRLIYLVQNPEHIEKILTHPKCLGKDYLYKFILDVIGTGLKSAPVPKWKKHRKIILPAFNQRILNSFVEIFAEKGIIFTEQLKKYVGKKDFNLQLLISRCTLDIICKSAMGIDINSQTTNNDFGIVLDRIMDITFLRIFKIWHHLDFTWRLYPMSRELDKCIKRLEDLTSTVIKKKIEAIERKKAARKLSIVAEIEEETKNMAFLDLILENSNFTEEEIMQEVEVFLIAGTDTTASSLCTLFTVLGVHQEVQQKLYEEAVDVLGEDRTVDASDLPNLKYTERVIKETLRLFPVGAFFLRTIGEDLDLGEAVLPTGSSAYFGTVHIHRNPKYWTDPLKFDADRFLPEEIEKRHPGTYLPFSLGPRNCIGAKYAMMNMKAIISTVIRKYKIFSEYKSIEEIELQTNLVLRLKDGPKVYLEHR